MPQIFHVGYDVVFCRISSGEQSMPPWLEHRRSLLRFLRIFSHQNYGEMSTGELSDVLFEQWGCLDWISYGSRELPAEIRTCNPTR